MKNNANPSLVRVRRVDYFLGKEPKYNIDQEKEDYVKGTEKFPFPKSVLIVARGLHALGKDACAMNKKEIFPWADHFLLGKPRPDGGTDEPAEVRASTVPQSATTTAAATDIEKVEEGEPRIGVVNVPVRVAIYTLLLSARELVTLDRKPDAQELGKLIDVPTEAYLKSLNKSSAEQAAPPAATVTEVPPPVVEAAPATSAPVPTPA
jgi:hypothetical protein